MRIAVFALLALLFPETVLAFDYREVSFGMTVEQLEGLFDAPLPDPSPIEPCCGGERTNGEDVCRTYETDSPQSHAVFQFNAENRLFHARLTFKLSNESKYLRQFGETRSEHDAAPRSMNAAIETELVEKYGPAETGHADDLIKESVWSGPKTAGSPPRGQVALAEDQTVVLSANALSWTSTVELLDERMRRDACGTMKRTTPSEEGDASRTPSARP